MLKELLERLAELMKGYHDNRPLTKDEQDAIDRVNRRVMWNVKTKLRNDSPPDNDANKTDEADKE